MVLKYRKKNKHQKPKSCKDNGKLIILSKCEVFHHKKLRFIKEQEASGLLSSMGIKTPLSRIPLVGPLLF